MFADALLDSHRQSRRGWATVTSFGIQAIALACLLIVLLFYTQVLPNLKWASPIFAPIGQVPVHVIQTSMPRPGISALPILPTAAHPIIVPSQISKTIDPGGDTGGSVGPISMTGCPQCTGTADPALIVANSIGTGPGPILAPPDKHPPMRVSSMMQGSLIHRVEPVYPALARTVRIQGTVLLEAVIGRDGAIQNLQVLSGHPLLVNAAVEAVRQWRYRPYILNGAPIEVDTQIAVNFNLGK